MKLRGRPGILLRTPFDRGFNDQLKGMVPRANRWFNEHASGWWIAEQHKPVIEHMAREWFGGIEILDGEGEALVVTAAGERCRQERLL